MLGLTEEWTGLELEAELELELILKLEQVFWQI